MSERRRAPVTADGLPDRRYGLRTGTAERRATKDIELLRRFEQEFQTTGKPTWPAHFARHVGFAGTSSLRYYPETRKAVSAYGWKTAPHKMRGVRPRAAAAAEDGILRNALEAECARLRKELQASTQALALTEERLTKANSELEQRRGELEFARAMVDELDSYLAHRDAAVARDIEQRLHRLSAEVTRVPERSIQTRAIAATPDHRHLRLMGLGGAEAQGEEP
jgi:hypothetical protein